MSTRTGQNVHPDRTECPLGPDETSTNQDNIQKGSRNLSEAENSIFQLRQERAEPPALDPDELEQKAAAYVHKLRGLAKELGPERALAYARQSCDGTHKDAQRKDVQIVKRALELWQAEERPRLKAGVENGRSNHRGRTVAIFTGPLKPVLLRLMWDDMARPGFHLRTPPQGHYIFRLSQTLPSRSGQRRYSGDERQYVGVLTEYFASADENEDDRLALLEAEK